MAQEAGSQPAGILEEPTVTSVLGVKGQLHFHPHGSTQKAHVVLRQVEIPEESDDEGDSSIVYFSLFAQKRIEVKPGKEILLAVATPDGKLLETPVVFAGRVSGEDDLTPGVSLQPSRIEPPPKAKPSVLPPKLRKPWHETQSAEPIASKDRARPTYASVEVQTDQINTSDERTRTASSATAPQSAAVGVQMAQSEHIPNVATSATLAQPVERPSGPSQRARSSSPMDLDSRQGSPASSSPPIPEPEGQSDARVKSKSFSPPGLTITMPSQQKLAKPEPLPVAKPVALPTSPNLSPDSDSPPGLSLPPLSAQSTAWPSVVPEVDPSVALSRERPVESPVTFTMVVPSPTAEMENAVPPVEGSSDGAVPTKQSSDSPGAPAAPYVPKRKTVPNPFVRGGVLTDFVGSAPPGKTLPQDASTGQSSAAQTTTQTEPVSIPLNAVPPPPTAPVPPVPPSPQSVADKPATPTRAYTPSRTPPLDSHSPPAWDAPHWRELSPPSSPASSSKVKVEDVPSLSSVTQSSSGISLAQFVNRLGPAPPPPPPRMPRFGGPPYAPDPRRAQMGSGMPGPQQQQPDYRSLAFVGEGPSTNPLNIKPAAGNKWKSSVPLPPQLSTAAPPRANSSKKPVHIGNGWPRNRQANGGGGRRRQKQNVFAGAPGQGMLGMQSPLAPDPSLGGVESSQWIGNGTSNGMADEARSTNGPARLRIRTRFGSPEARDDPEPTTPVDASPISSSNPDDSPTSTKSSQGLNSLEPKAPAQNGPAPASAWSPGRGVKRAASPTPSSPDTRRMRTFNWPTSNGLYTVKLKGDDDVGVRSITHCSDGNLFAAVCNDKSVRVWSNKTRTEIAKLAHNMQVISVAWMDRDSGVVTLGENGIVSTWTRSAANKWQWAKILNAGDRKGEDMPGCLAFHRDRMAISYPRSGVKVWLFIKGTWTPQRSIVRQNVTAIRFVEDGEALIGGTTDGVLWHCQVPNGTLRASAFLRSKIAGLDVDPRGTHAVAAQHGGCILVSITQGDGKGSVEQTYSPKDPELQTNAVYDFGALFATRGMSLLFGSIQGCVMVWDRGSGDIVHGLNHGDDYDIQAVASFDGSSAFEGYILTGTRQGQLTWFPQPPVDGSENRKGAR